MNVSDEEANNKAIDSLINYETVKQFNNEIMEARNFDKSMSEYEKATIKIWTYLAWMNFGQTAIFTIGATTCMIMSGAAVMSGKQTVGDFVLVNALLMQLSIPLNFIGFIYREIRQGITDLDSLMKVMNVKPEIVDKKNAKVLRIQEGKLSFKNVSFSYDPRRTVLSDVNFRVEPGQKFAIVGASGSGKSTVGRLLFRFYDTDNGVISIDGLDIRKATQDSLRAIIGVVPQDCVLFNDTILYNIAYGQPEATRNEIEEAARQAAIHEFIMSTPDKYETLVGERGLKISGGEKQRVAIARTILKRPQILVFDEATSALDTNTEREIQNALNKISQNTTTLIIAHRLSTVIDADKILVLNKGCIEEEGTHTELLAKNGLYAEMWNEQQREDNAGTE